MVSVGVRDPAKAKAVFDNERLKSIRQIDVLNERIPVHDIDTVFNLAAVVPDDEIDTEEGLMVNALGTYNLLRACHDSAVDRFIHSSSMSVFGNPESLPVTESHPLRPETEYAVSKGAAEWFCQLDIWDDLQRVVLRYSSVYGPRMNPNQVVALFMRRLSCNEDITAYCNNSSDFLHVTDAARANKQAASVALPDTFIDFNIGSGTERTIEEVAMILQAQTESNGDIEYVYDENPSRFVFDIDRAQRLLGYEPQITFSEGIQDWYENTDNPGTGLME
jgi:UDP-glucose 4-epimerase